MLYQIPNLLLLYIVEAKLLLLLLINAQFDLKTQACCSPFLTVKFPTAEGQTPAHIRAGNQSSDAEKGHCVCIIYLNVLSEIDIFTNIDKYLEGHLNFKKHVGTKCKATLINIYKISMI